METIESAAIRAMNAHSIKNNFSLKVKKSSTSNTSNTGAAFGGDNPALTQHKAAPTPTIDDDSLIVETDNGKGTVKKALLIESKACLLLKKALNGFLANDC